ncbi:MAG TPA: PstS family phosphate ABC transporter substrate-binding protein [Leptospiraceae bacterium]|jgi:phosphate transport system substrate-binding protein|nr:PstS family phosphate ABC transporter substrate-binding protein [Leptospirales bacterium]HMU82699.1 PstS family phosphate ABC transporter substrate-binding protein [Leptospiraceae bacterium]HMW59728.1 PstS family phosphate ABC transporter substrate-binding protein [Leptospiraceae bacterium]HMX57037.1 PstS family phosphate ABC transporter substrate-binding protein [Leptospiraceae bacterium]HMZ35520.1 PstS family phosphate ABC transporter substrate-binding protein [Leptospiraceae bacterium]
MNQSRAMLATIPLAAALFLTSACKERKIISIDGSSTVGPISMAVAEDFQHANGNVKVTVGISGTGGGFKKFCNGETDISDASRPIKKEEVEACKTKAIEYVELPVAYDGLAVLVSPQNDWVKELTTEQLKKIFTSENPAKTWKEVNPAWPDAAIKIFAPGKDSGTHDYFVEEILGKKKQMRPDASFSESDNVLVTGISGEKNSIGFFGLAYFENNKDKLKLVPIVNPKTKAAVLPSVDTVKSGEYAPLSRPLFIYVSTKAAAKEEVKAYIDFYLTNGAKLSAQVGYIALPDGVYTKAKSRFASLQTGSVFQMEGHEGKTIEQVFN